jgi:hypothetical protein
MASITFDDEPCAVQRACAELGPWHVLVGCLLLNLTTRTQAKRVLPRFFEMFPEPQTLREELTDENINDLVNLLTPLGLVNRRMVALLAMTDDFLDPLIDIEDVRYCGQYCQDSYNIFVLHRIVPVRDDMDKEIRRYLLERSK